MQGHVLPVLRPLADLLGGVVASAGVGSLHLDQLVPLHSGHSLGLTTIGSELLELLSELELYLRVLEACQRL